MTTYIQYCDPFLWCGQCKVLKKRSACLWEALLLDCIVLVPLSNTIFFNPVLASDSLHNVFKQLEKRRDTLKQMYLWFKHRWNGRYQCQCVVVKNCLIIWVNLFYNCIHWFASYVAGVSYQSVMFVSYGGHYLYSRHWCHTCLTPTSQRSIPVFHFILLR